MRIRTGLINQQVTVGEAAHHLGQGVDKRLCIAWAPMFLGDVANPVDMECGHDFSGSVAVVLVTVKNANAPDFAFRLQ